MSVTMLLAILFCALCMGSVTAQDTRENTDTSGSFYIARTPYRDAQCTNQYQEPFLVYFGECWELEDDGMAIHYRWLDADSTGFTQCTYEWPTQDSPWACDDSRLIECTRQTYGECVKDSSLSLHYKWAPLTLPADNGRVTAFTKQTWQVQQGQKTCGLADLARKPSTFKFENTKFGFESTIRFSRIYEEVLDKTATNISLATCSCRPISSAGQCLSYRSLSPAPGEVVICQSTVPTMSTACPAEALCRTHLIDGSCETNTTLMNFRYDPIYANPFASKSSEDNGSSGLHLVSLVLLLVACVSLM